MDRPRTDAALVRRRRRLRWLSAAAIAATIVTVLVLRLEPAAPKVDRALVWIDTVVQGEMVREIRGLGTLVPEDARWIPARSAGRVEEIVLRPGATVEADSILLRLSNPDVAQAARTADLALQAAEAELANLQVQLQRSLLEAESAAARARSEYEQARLQAQVNEELFAEGLIAPIQRELSRVTADELRTRADLENRRFAFSRDAIEPQLAVRRAEVDRARAAAALAREELAALDVRAGRAGVLQVLPLEVGQQVTPGTNLARVADPSRLKAEIRIPETQARDLTIGLPAIVNTRQGQGEVEARVARIDPAVQNGTVTVDLSVISPLPRGARPDLSVDGRIQLERLPDVLHVGRPAFSQEEGTASLFRLLPDGRTAVRTAVRLGRTSVSAVEILSGLNPGDRVILSDMSQWEAVDRVRLD